jgi:hypothetical protein
MWSIRYIIAVPSGRNAAIEYMQGQENTLTLEYSLFYSDPCPITNSEWYINDDWSYSEGYTEWDSYESYQKWYETWGNEYDTYEAELERHCKEKGIRWERKHSPHDDYDWLSEGTPLSTMTPIPKEWYTDAMVSYHTISSD